MHLQDSVHKAYMHTCICICIVHIHTHTYIYMYMYMYMIYAIYAFIYVYIVISIYLSIYLSIYTCYYGFLSKVDRVAGSWPKLPRCMTTLLEASRTSCRA